MSETSKALRIWTIYKSPLDHPGRFVVRPWIITPYSDPVAESVFTCHDTLTAARAAIPAGKFKMVRDPTDDPQIVETWI
jgi:hypothetical protein